MSSTNQEIILACAYRLNDKHVVDIASFLPFLVDLFRAKSGHRIHPRLSQQLLLFSPYCRRAGDSGSTYIHSIIAWLQCLSTTRYQFPLRNNTTTMETQSARIFSWWVAKTWRFCKSFRRRPPHSRTNEVCAPEILVLVSGLGKRFSASLRL